PTASEVMPPSRSLTGPASPRRSVCAPGEMSPQCIADHDQEPTMNPILSAMSRYSRRPQLDHSHPRTGKRKARQRPYLEALEDRTVPTTISVANASLNEIGSPSAFVTAGSGGLNTPSGITLGPDGNLYVAGNGGAVLRYNGTTGAYLNTFVRQGSGGLSLISGSYSGLAFGPDGNLYVASANTNQVLEYKGNTGAFLQAFVPAAAR